MSASTPLRFRWRFVEEIRRIRASEIEEVGGKLITKVRDSLTEVVRFDEARSLPRLEPVNGYFGWWWSTLPANRWAWWWRKCWQGRNRHQESWRVSAEREAVSRGDDRARRQSDSAGRCQPPDGGRVHRAPSADDRAERGAFSCRVQSRWPAAKFPPRPWIVEKEKLVLLVDDSISVRKFVGRMLEKAGYRVKLASDGLEALEIATASQSTW